MGPSLQLQRGVFTGSEFHHPETNDLYARVEEEYGVDPVYYPSEELANLGGPAGGAQFSQPLRDMPPVGILLGSRLENMENAQLALSVAERLLSLDVPIAWCATRGSSCAFKALHGYPLVMCFSWNRRQRQNAAPGPAASGMRFQFARHRRDLTRAGTARTRASRPPCTSSASPRSSSPGRRGEGPGPSSRPQCGSGKGHRAVPPPFAPHALVRRLPTRIHLPALGLVACHANFRPTFPPPPCTVPSAPTKKHFPPTSPRHAASLAAKLADEAASLTRPQAAACAREAKAAAVARQALLLSRARPGALQASLAEAALNEQIAFNAR